MFSFSIFRPPWKHSPYVLVVESSNLNEKSNQEKSEVEGQKKLCFSLVLFKEWFNRYVTLGDGSEFCHEAL